MRLWVLLLKPKLSSKLPCWGDRARRCPCDLRGDRSRRGLRAGDRSPIGGLRIAEFTPPLPPPPLLPPPPSAASAASSSCASAAARSDAAVNADIGMLVEGRALAAPKAPAVLWRVRPSDVAGRAAGSGCSEGIRKTLGFRTPRLRATSRGLSRGVSTCCLRHCSDVPGCPRCAGTSERPGA